jgi:hypothetical protein
MDYKHIWQITKEKHKILLCILIREAKTARQDNSKPLSQEKRILLHCNTLELNWEAKQWEFQEG